MKATTTLPPGVFHGGEIENGTFHAIVTAFGSDGAQTATPPPQQRPVDADEPPTDAGSTTGT